MKETKVAFLPDKFQINEKCSDENNLHRIINHIFFCHCKMCWKIQSKITQVQPVCVFILKQVYWIFIPLCWIILSTQNHSSCRPRSNFLLELFQRKTIEKGRYDWTTFCSPFFPPGNVYLIFRGLFWKTTKWEKLCACGLTPLNCWLKWKHQPWCNQWAPRRCLQDFCQSKGLDHNLSGCSRGNRHPFPVLPK